MVKINTGFVGNYLSIYDVGRTLWPRTFSPGRFGHGHFGKIKVHKGRFGQMQFQHRKKLYMNFLCFNTYSLSKTIAWTVHLMQFARSEKIKRKKEKK